MQTHRLLPSHQLFATTQAESLLRQEAERAAASRSMGSALIKSGQMDTGLSEEVVARARALKPDSFVSEFRQLVGEIADLYTLLGASDSDQRLQDRMLECRDRVVSACMKS